MESPKKNTRVELLKRESQEGDVNDITWAPKKAVKRVQHLVQNSKNLLTKFNDYTKDSEHVQFLRQELYYPEE